MTSAVLVLSVTVAVADGKSGQRAAAQVAHTPRKMT